MDKNDDERQQLIYRTLALQAGASHATVVEHGLRAWERLAAQLSPLIGETGLCALYARALRLAMPQYPFPAPTTGSIAVFLATLRENLASADTQTASEANAALLDTFTGLLASLIGNSLTVRQMHAAWNDTYQQKNTQEHKQ